MIARAPFSVNITDNPPVYDPAIWSQDWKLDSSLRGMEANLSDLKFRLKNARGINRRVRLGKQINACTARILALKLAHR